MVTKFKALRDCAVVAGIDVHEFKSGDIAGIEMTADEAKFFVERGDIEVLSGKVETPKVEAPKAEVEEPVKEEKKTVKKSKKSVDVE